MADPDEPTKDEIIEALSKDNARLSKLLAISEYQKDHLKDQCKHLRETATNLLSKNTSSAKTSPSAEENA